MEAKARLVVGAGKELFAQKISEPKLGKKATRKSWIWNLII